MTSLKNAFLVASLSVAALTTQAQDIKLPAPNLNKQTKGDHLSNEESKNKLEIGKAIANEANKLDGVSNKYHYFMVYKTKQVENAHTVQEFLKILDKSKLASYKKIQATTIPASFVPTRECSM